MFKKPNKIAVKEISISGEKTLVQVFWIFTFTLLTALGAQVEIPNQPVPYTLQTFFVLSAGALLGKRAAFLSMGLYLILGAIGLPVFSGGSFGFARIFGPTGGYLLSFPIAAFIVGSLVRYNNEYWWIVISFVLGSLVVFSIGLIYLNFIYVHDWMNSLQAGFLIFSWWDGVKIIGGATITHYYFRKVKLPKN